jgi:hypothetical protein
MKSITVRAAVATLVTVDNEVETGSCVIDHFDDPAEQEAEIDRSKQTAVNEVLDRYSENISDDLPAGHRIVVQIMDIPVKVRVSTFLTSIPEVLEEPTADINIA